MELNKVLLVGNLGRDPEARFLPSGDQVCEFNIAVNRTYKDRQGERQQETTWIKIVTFGKQAEFCSNYLRKGKSVFVEGRLRLSTWEGQDGQKHSRHDVIAERVQFAAPRSQEEGGGGGGEYAEEGAPRGGAGQPASGPPAEGGETAEDDLPF